MSNAAIVAQGRDKQAFRGDIQGLRAVAVLMVMLWHAGWKAIPGGFVGVDIFFVISGFLMTGLLLREAGQPRGISLTAFYARRARRLLPASALVLAFVAIASRLLLPQLRWTSIGYDLLASVGFVENWRLAHQSVDYLTATTGSPGPLQHFWSLGVEEQFYFVWPILLLLFVARARRRRASPALPVLALVLLVAAASLVWSVVLTRDNPGQAYFVTTTRLWELAVGGGVAVLGSQTHRIPTAVAASIGWAGLLAALAAGVLFDANTPFPGYTALLPVLGAAAVIGGGPAAGPWGPIAVLGLWPMRKIGNWSYSLYLWHWPLIVFATAKWGALTQAQGFAVLCLSFVPALFAYRFVEEPVRTSESWSLPNEALKNGGLTLLGGATAGLVFIVLVPSVPPVDLNPAASLISSSGQAPAKFGAQLLAADPLGDKIGKAVNNPGAFTPRPEQLTQFKVGCAASTTEKDLKTCDMGDRLASTHVVLLGDSHALQWALGLDIVAKERGWRLTLITKDFCAYGTTTLDSPWFDSCKLWRNKVATYLARERPSVVITSQYDYALHSTSRGRLGSAESARMMAADLRNIYAELVAAGSQVIVLQNTPQPGINMGECVAAHPDHLTQCAVPQAKALAGVGAAQTIASIGLRGVHLVDLNTAICPVDPCAAVIGGVLVYVDNNHITYTYGQSLAPRLSRAFALALGRA